MTTVEDRDAAIQWARDLCAAGFVVLDTETTGMDSFDEVIQIGMLQYAPDSTVSELLNVLVQPIAAPIHRKAFEVHGITMQDIRDNGAAPISSLHDVLRVQTVGMRVVIYNAPFDVRLLNQSFKACGFLESPLAHLTPAQTQRDDVMLRYAEFVGELNTKRGGYKWQKLPGGDHTGLGDCYAALRVIKQMANTRTSAQELAITRLHSIEFGTGSVTQTDPDDAQAHAALMHDVGVLVSDGAELVNGDEFADLDLADDATYDDNGNDAEHAPN